VVCKYQKFSSKKAGQPKLVVFYCLVWATELLLAAISLIFPALVVLGYYFSIVESMAYQFLYRLDGARQKVPLKVVFLT
jgi:hypothetical protein